MTEELKNVRLPIMVTEREATAIDDWRFTNRVTTRAEAIRRLIAIGLVAQPALAKLAEHLENAQGSDAIEQTLLGDLKDALGRDHRS